MLLGGRLYFMLIIKIQHHYQVSNQRVNEHEYRQRIHVTWKPEKMEDREWDRYAPISVAHENTPNTVKHPFCGNMNGQQVWRCRKSASWQQKRAKRGVEGDAARGPW